MKTTEFYSDRIGHMVGIVLTPKYVYYISSIGDEWRLKRDVCWHFNKDGLLRAQEYFEDPRFDKWVDEYSREEDAEFEVMMKSFSEL